MGKSSKENSDPQHGALKQPTPPELDNADTAMEVETVSQAPEQNLKSSNGNGGNKLIN